jgi:hypothetical protein
VNRSADRESRADLLIRLLRRFRERFRNWPVADFAPARRVMGV